MGAELACMAENYCYFFFFFFFFFFFLIITRKELQVHALSEKFHESIALEQNESCLACKQTVNG